MSGHTKGPWRVEAHTTERGGSIGPNDDWTVYADGETHAIAYEGGHNPNADADAHLIAAAPDLLAALLEAQDTLLAYDGHVTNPMYAEGWTDQDGYKAYAKARAAIARATGEQP